MILTHLTDPQEKELVKAELSRRYYEHYLGLGKEAGRVRTDQPAANLKAEEEHKNALPGAAGGGDQPPGQDIDAATDDAPLGDLEAVQPVDLPSPVPSDRPRQQSSQPPAGKKKRCFIATAAYESPCASQVILLQQFRERSLCGRPWGERCLRLYYRLSPAVADILDRCPNLRPLVRGILAPLIWWLGCRPGRTLRPRT